MKKLTVRDAAVQNKRVLIRVDYNVPIRSGRVEDDTRIRETLPTLEYLLRQGAKVVLLSHAGRPKGREAGLSLKPVGARLSELLQSSVGFRDECVGPAAAQAVSALKPGQALLLENLRFHPEEEKNDLTFAAELGALGDAYVNDAFGVSHRAHASVHALPKLFPKAYAGFLMEKEIRELGRLLENPERPFVALLGGAKVSDKITVIENLLGKLDALLIGGAMAYTFIKSAGIEVGASLVEPDKLETAKRIRQEAQARGVKLVLPRDHKIVRSIHDSMDTRPQEGSIARDWMGVDIGPMTVVEFQGELKKAKTVFWNGPLGAFEIEAYARGTNQIAKFLAELPAVKILGGGDTALAVQKAGVKDKMTHVSTGGGAALEFLEGKELPGIAALSNA